MNTIVLNILFAVIWLIIGHFFGIFSLFFSFVFFPLLYLVSAYHIKYNLSSVIVIPFCFLLIFLNDYLFRFYGGGIHDDAGRGLCELIFYLTFLATTITMFFVAYKMANNNKANWLYNSLLVVGSASVTYLAFIKLSVKI